MNCSDIEDTLDKFQQGLLSAEERQAFDAHLETCLSCRGLMKAVSGSLDIPPLPVPQDLTGSILERTSGRACGRARELLCDYSDGALDSSYAEIISLHLEHCSECTALAQSLAELNEMLPQMGEIDPGMGFTFRVLRATSRRPRESRPSISVRLKQWWLRLIQRPRFSWEAAYLGTVILVSLMGNPLNTFNDLSQRIADVHKSNRSFSLVSVALPGSLVRSETGILKDTREFAGAFSARQSDLAKSAEGLCGQCAHALQSTVQSHLKLARALPSRAFSTLERAWAALFPGHSK